MSGWPVERPSPSASPSQSIGYFCPSVRNGGALRWGLVPVRSMAWHLAQWVATSVCPRLRSALSCANARATAVRLNKTISNNRAIGIRSSGLGIVATAGLRAGIPDSLHQGVAQERLFHDRDVGACSAARQLRSRVARDQDRGRRNRLFPQLED